MPLTLYYDPLSSPSRAVLTFLNLTGIEYDKKVINALKEEHKSSKYLKINPTGLVPAIQDNDVFISEPEDIIKYLINSRKVGQEYYPTDPFIRTEIDKYMLFHPSIFSEGIKQYFIASYASIMHSKLTKAQVQPDLEETLGEFQDFFLKNRMYIAGDQLTIADFFAISELTMLSLATDFDFSKFPVVKRYIERCLKNDVINEVSWPLRDFAIRNKQPVKRKIPHHRRKLILKKLVEYLNPVEYEQCPAMCKMMEDPLIC